MDLNLKKINIFLYHLGFPSPQTTAVSVAHAFNPYHLMGYQPSNKATNEYAMNMLKPQQLATVVVPISSGIPAGTPVVAPAPGQFVAANPHPPGIAASPQPNHTAFAAYPPPGPGPAAVFPGYQIGIKWNIGDLCMAKYWEDGRVNYYNMQIVSIKF